MFWLRNKKIVFLLHTLISRPDISMQHDLSINISCGNANFSSSCLVSTIDFSTFSIGEQQGIDEVSFMEANTCIT